MKHRLDLAGLRERVRRAVPHDESLRARMLPRDAHGNPARPLDPPNDITPRDGAVLILIYPNVDELYLPLTVRTSSLRHHSGEISLPGGRFDPADLSLERTALRETAEEIGVQPETVEIVTALDPVWIPVSNFRIVPYVGVVEARPPFALAPDEVAGIVEVPLPMLADPRIIRSEVRDIRGRLLSVPYFAIDEHKVWGATALVLAQLLARLEAD